MALAYQRALGNQWMAVYCNLDGKGQKVNMKEAWNGCQVLLDNDARSEEGRNIHLTGGAYEMEPYELLVFGEVKDGK